MIKQLTIAALAAASTVAPAAAQFTHNGNVFYEASDFSGAHAAIVEQLWEVGIPVVDGRNTDLCPTERVLGWYTGEGNFMVICHGDAELRAETLTHEAVHAVQDCRAGLDNAKLEDPTKEDVQWWAEQIPNKTAMIVNNYPERAWFIEAEAFFYETRPAAVSDDLYRACGATEWKF